jgi:hypothetical protein
MNTDDSQTTIARIRDAMHGTALVGDLPIRQRVAPMAYTARTIRRLGQEGMNDGTALLRDLAQERFGVVG